MTYPCQIWLLEKEKPIHLSQAMACKNTENRWTGIPFFSSSRMLLLSALLMLMTMADDNPAAADSALDFYRGRDISLFISTGPGGGYDSYGRVLARHYGRHLPSSPNIIVQNMPGAGGLRATNHIFSAAPKDGTAIALVHSSAPFAPLLGMPGGKFDATQFSWIGSMNKEGNLCVAWHSSQIQSFEDLLTKDFIVGGTGASSQLETYPKVINKLFGTHIKIVSGYQGGTDVDLAMERGEVDGRCGHSMTSLRSTRPQWLANNKVRIIIQTSLESEPDLKEVPMILDYARNAEERAILELVFADQAMLRPIIAPPDVPGDRVAALRDALKAVLEDVAFLAEAEKQHLAIRYVSASEIEQLIRRVYASSPSIVNAAAEAMQLR
jgi:tripartite-type tricarboxylate transporter receptor subunit TctC